MIFSFKTKYLVTRSEGEALRKEMVSLLQTGDPASYLELDFHRVTAMTHSFVDECLGKFLTGRAAGDIPPVLLTAFGLNDNTAEEVDIALHRRKVGLIRTDGPMPVLLGGDDYLKTTFERAAALSEFRAVELAAELQTTPQNINNRLKTLSDSGALQRVRSTIPGGGREFVYRLPPAAHQARAVA